MGVVNEQTSINLSKSVIKELTKKDGVTEEDNEGQYVYDDESQETPTYVNKIRKF